jgi:hypothetical protein
MKKVLGLILVLVFAASYAQAQAVSKVVTNRGEVITVYVAEGGGDTNQTENTGQAVPADFTVGDDLVVTDDASVGGDLTVTGAAIGNDLDARTATTLLLGKSTATRVEIGDTGIVIEAEGPFTATEDILSNELDAETATALLIGKATATSVTIGASDAGVSVPGTLAVTGVATLTAAPKLTAVTSAGSATATMTNAPAAGNPIAWANVSIGTNTYVVPLFAKE